MTLNPTPTQTVGPYFTLGMMREGDNVLVQPGTEGKRIRIEGYIYGGDGDPLFNVLLEIWQTNAHGRYNHPLDQRPLPLDPAFIGFGRASTDPRGHYWFQTVKPGPCLTRGRSCKRRTLSCWCTPVGWRIPCSPGCTSRTTRATRPTPSSSASPQTAAKPC
jgi:protocatechuate 3,4-dioxygenase beta subunit